MRRPSNKRFYAVSGCSSGGKSTLIAALADRGFATVPEPGRRIVAAGNPGLMPWTDPVAFSQAAAELAQADLRIALQTKGPVFFDRGLIDAACALEHLCGEAIDVEGVYASCLFFAPLWPEIFVNDTQRLHGLQEALDEAARLRDFAPRYGYELVDLPLASVEERVDFVVERIADR